MSPQGHAGEAAHPGVLSNALIKSAHGSTTDAVTDALREAILQGTLVASTWLREDELATAFGVSRTPVREALRRLSDEGLTQRVANRGSVIAPMTIDEVLAVYAVREGLEGIAARTVAARPAPGLIDALHDVQRRMTEDLGSPASTMAAHNLEFHRLIREATGNPYLERFLTQVEHAVRRFGRSTFALSGRPEQALEEHFGIIEAIAAGAPELAEERAVRHMRNARETRIAQMLAG